mmetsp:Transcript_107755/g.230041  ORF Transcript_107755/g.230041 Transcript_107755/m.230041 type:complete len:242 (+) Transcript_107755:140-865(+)
MSAPPQQVSIWASSSSANSDGGKIEDVRLCRPTPATVALAAIAGSATLTLCATWERGRRPRGPPAWPDRSPVPQRRRGLCDKAGGSTGPGGRPATLWYVAEAGEAGWSNSTGFRSALPSASPQLSARERASGLPGPKDRHATCEPCRKATAAEAHCPRCSRSAPRLWQATANKVQASRDDGEVACWRTRMWDASTANLSAPSWLPTPDSAAQAFSFVVATEMASCGALRALVSSARSARPR